MPTLSMEDYLKALYHLQAQQPRVHTTALARWLGVAPASATEMLRRLAAWQPP
ncbi:MAG: metal-dependent transcriptional regulator, partial [Chloroflexi bacterium]|nr:metal-dependent transcriptional regulator [Chloroflexota bacterium]